MTLKQLRKSLGLTQAQAGAKLGISSQSFYSLEKNWPNIETRSMIALVQAFGASIIVDLDGSCEIVPATQLKNPPA